ncbi:MAG: pyridoxal phosphate-dependent aminotransferase [Defluviitaleaceae bacterium]|nr:pyridoxal phosphate-dependent aminotransferase [Defluviitaleaceae bacterium]MCL2836113.1 pyridoxal phosphate-dependent aminotransferase [Defluviitaleaceae bacterium]
MNYSKKAEMVKESSTLAITAKAKALREAGRNVISFSIGEPDFNTPGHIVEAAKKALDAGFTKYTDSSGILKLREAICGKLQRENGLSYKPGQIVVANGAKHAISNACLAILNEGDEVIIPAPYWLTYPEVVALSGGVPVVAQTDKKSGYKISPAQLEAAITPKTKALFLNSPNNPSGSVYTEEELRAIAEVVCRRGLIVISDEIYEHLIYVPGLKHISIASFNEDIFNRTIVINGLSKSYAMTGWRMGYTASNQELAKIMGNIQSHQTSNINSVTQQASIAAIDGDQQPLRDMLAQFAKRREYIASRLMGIKGFDMDMPAGAFYAFIDISEMCGKAKGISVTNASDFAAELIAKKGVAIVPCADFGCDMHIRLSYAMSTEDITEGVDRIEAFVSEYW